MLAIFSLALAILAFASSSYDLYTCKQLTKKIEDLAARRGIAY
jgi:hypothetical protein